MALMKKKQRKKGIHLECKLGCIICLEFFGREVTCKVNVTTELFNNKTTVFLPLHTIYSRIKALYFYTALTGKARQGQAEIN